MLEMPSAVLIIGDSYVSKNIILSAKKKYEKAQWETVSATEQTPDEIRMISGFNSFGNTDKIVLIQDIPNKKQVREFIVDLIQSSTDSLKFVIWDSNCHIKIDPKTREILKTWADFVKVIKNLPNTKIIDNGGDFTEKESIDCIKYVHDSFKKFGKTIDDRAAILFVDVVGRNRGMILSEAKKISLNSPDKVDSKFVLENVFPTSCQNSLYKFGNAVDTGDISNAINSFEEFAAHGVSPYVLADILLKRARWQLVVAHLWMSNIPWMDISDIVMDMGKFPSLIWHDAGMSVAQKKRVSEDYDNLSSKVRFLSLKMGIPKDCFNGLGDCDSKEGKEGKEDKGGSSESIPLKFIAQQIVDVVRSKMVEPNKNKFTMDVLKSKVFDKYLKNYITILDLVKDIRYNMKDCNSSIYEIMSILTNFELEETMQ